MILTITDYQLEELLKNAAGMGKILLSNNTLAPADIARELLASFMRERAKDMERSLLVKYGTNYADKWDEDFEVAQKLQEIEHIYDKYPAEPFFN